MSDNPRLSNIKKLMERYNTPLEETTRIYDNAYIETETLRDKFPNTTSERFAELKHIWAYWRADSIVYLTTEGGKKKQQEDREKALAEAKLNLVHQNIEQMSFAQNIPHLLRKYRKAY